MSETPDHDGLPSDNPGSPVDHSPVDHEAVGESTGSMARVIAVVVGLIVVGLIALFASGGIGGRTTKASALLDRRVPEMRATATDGREFDIDNLRGQWVLVNFFGTWCPPCVAEHPELVKLEEWGEANGRLSLVSIAFADSPENVQGFFDANGGNWPVLDDANLSVKFQIAQVPESFLIAPSGLVVEHFTGGIEADPLIDLIAFNDTAAGSTESTVPSDEGGG